MKVIKVALLSGILIAGKFSYAQELFSYTEPASNMPANSVGVRLSNWIMDNKASNFFTYKFQPEIMWGVNKNLMLHAEGFFSNRNRTMKVEGGAFYAKYRFFTTEQVNKHFRLAAFARAGINNTPVFQEDIETNGDNSGYEIGLIATRLLHRQAISASVSFERALDNAKGNNFPANQTNKAINYTLSTGRLLLPKEYKNYEQVNLNVMLELLGQSLVGSNKAYLDIAPVVQFIFNSQARVDLGYRIHIYNNMTRMANSSYLVRLEYLFF